jgi:hypothetical protein
LDVASLVACSDCGPIVPLTTFGGSGETAVMVLSIQNDQMIAGADSDFGKAPVNPGWFPSQLAQLPAEPCGVQSRTPRDGDIHPIVRRSSTDETPAADHAAFSTA